MTERESFRAEAVRTLRRQVPDDLEWLFRGELPALSWSGDGGRVEEVIPRGWLVAAALRGVPEPDAEMRRRAALFEGAGAAAFGAWLLGAWIERDTAVPGLTDARRDELRAIAERAAGLARRLGRGGTEPEERFRQLVAQEGNRTAPSALEHRGLLAVVAVCAGAEVVPEVESYLAAQHRQRPAQCRALRRMVASIDGGAAAWRSQTRPRRSNQPLG